MFQISAGLSPTSCLPAGPSPRPCSAQRPLLAAPLPGLESAHHPLPRASPPMATTSKEGAWSPRGGRAEGSSPAQALLVWAGPSLGDKELC